jgi:7-cyano-7-deazaguanine reductase
MSADLLKTLDHTIPLGQKSPYPQEYDPGLLFPISRGLQRSAMGFLKPSFFGADVWNAYELCWLNQAGKPVRAIASFNVPCDSDFLVESKSVKLYLNSISHKKFKNLQDVGKLISEDISKACNADVSINLHPKELNNIFESQSENYFCLDDLDVAITHYTRTPGLLSINENVVVEDKVFSHLFKSHCLVTGQPDWGSIFIHYRGPELNRQGLLAYLISYHNHVGFSENCVEQIYVDIIAMANPTFLYVNGRFTRRGGIDINPVRSTHPIQNNNWRLAFQ